MQICDLLTSDEIEEKSFELQTGLLKRITVTMEIGGRNEQIQNGMDAVAVQ